jgi:hypothetical protein
VNLENLITVPWMEVQTLPFKVGSDSLSVHAEVNHALRSWKQGAIRAESDQAHWRSRGRYYGELNVKHLKKRPTVKRESVYIST